MGARPLWVRAFVFLQVFVANLPSVACWRCPVPPRRFQGGSSPRQDLQVIVLVHEQDEYLVRVLVVIVNFEPVDLGFGESDLALRCVLVGALVDLGIGDRHQVALGGAYLDCPVVIAECEHRFNVLSFRGGHTDAVERRLVGKAD